MGRTVEEVNPHRLEHRFRDSVHVLLPDKALDEREDRSIEALPLPTLLLSLPLLRLALLLRLRVRHDHHIVILLTRQAASVLRSLHDHIAIRVVSLLVLDLVVLSKPRIRVTVLARLAIDVVFAAVRTDVFGVGVVRLFLPLGLRVNVVVEVEGLAAERIASADHHRRLSPGSCAAQLGPISTSSSRELDNAERRSADPPTYPGLKSSWNLSNLTLIFNLSFNRSYNSLVSCVVSEASLIFCTVSRTM